MWWWGSTRRLTHLLLDLTEDEDLSKAFAKDPDRIIKERRLGRYAELLKKRDVPELRAAVRAELGLPKRGMMPGVMASDAIIAGVRGVKEPPPEGMQGVREPPPSEEAMMGVQQPPPEEPIGGVKEPPPPDEPIGGVKEPPPPDSA